MIGELISSEREAAESLIGWWVEAGVDAPVAEEPRDWLGRRPQPVASTAAAPITSERPADLKSFHHWLATADGLPMGQGASVRIAPKGPVEAPVMLMSDLPDRDDAADRQPIGGQSYALAVRMLAAIGIDADAAYHASLSCFHAPGARIGRDELDSCAAIARDHIRLARPQRLILFGDAPSRALLGEPLARARGRIHRLEGVRTIATFHPRWLLQRPADKALAWSDLLLLMSEGD